MPTYTEPTTGMEFIFVEGGLFQMGSDQYHSHERPAHWVQVNDFYMAKYPITQGQWKALVKDNPSWFKKGDDYPVENISWEDVTNLYLPKLNKLGGGKYRLPTEAEWEYAARSGGKAETYAGGETLDEVGWYKKNSGGSTHPVGKKQPNGLGLYDMSGNVWEWCHDWYSNNYLENPRTSPTRENPRNNPQGPRNHCNGEYRAARGGSWDRAPTYSRTSRRNRISPDRKIDFDDDYDTAIGARLVVSFLNQPSTNNSQLEPKSSVDDNNFPDEVPQHFEGATKQVFVNIYERNPVARRACIARYGLNCSVCNFNFKATYGEIGSDFIHVHHLTPIATIGNEYQVDPINDLRPVCPNCHAMLHRRKDQPLSIDELKKLISTHE